MSVLSKPYFRDEEKAFEYLESVLWTDGKSCPHCGGTERITKVKANPAKRIRLGLWRCGDCKRQFTVKIGTVFEHARMPLYKMLQAVYLMTCSKKGISAHQLSRVLEVTYKTAWFLAHRIREAMRSGDLAPFGGEGGVVEVDETFIGRREGVDKPRGGTRHMIPVLSLVHRESGQCRSFVVDNVKAETLLDTILIELWRRFKVEETRKFLQNKLWRMAQKKLIYTVPGKKGVYTAMEPPRTARPQPATFDTDLDDDVPF
jgi:transposase-like protein